MNVYKLSRVCSNNPYREEELFIFDCQENVLKYITKDGKSHEKISIVGVPDDKITSYDWWSDTAIIKSHFEAYENDLLGLSVEAGCTEYVCRKIEVRNYGFFKP